ncbi:hypothetical protein E4656_02155 [Natronospirillum operosum]|uniref:Polymerase nucleotidyl transferase domain-containing protein n=1 Tax=Natronospirillum operosum TaxID=2759953 RepID=A0A4Z0WHI6_9GAMM|nr:nucleotidyltransferase domain-containing protein [Natronospirillum operosum]TGG95246.1 hypothetical protein E4656_02155 [Natronospirillum operosum]
MSTKDSTFQDFPELAKRSDFTQKKLKTLRDRFKSIIESSDYSEQITIVTTGSYGRGEASEESDLDLFILLDADEPVKEAIPDVLDAIKQLIDEEVPKSTGETTTFGPRTVIKFSEMLQNIGGSEDDNESLTRRMLYLLEGTWLYGQKRFERYRHRLLEKYIKEDSPDHQLSKFFLNEIIRYYRTIATDFEHKVSERNKEWGLRSTKLRFSRKLLYFGGLITVAEVSELTQAEKVERSISLLEKPVLERVAALSDSESQSTREIFRIYEQFLTAISDPEIRQTLEQTDKESRHDCKQYMQLRELSSEFSNRLATWIEEQFNKEHPIHHSLIF